MNTTESNKLIAEFMGAESFGGSDKWLQGIDPYPHAMHIESLEYHTSWDWLMPVVEKIEGLDIRSDLGDGVSVTHKYEVEIKRNYCCIEPDITIVGGRGFRGFKSDKLQSTYAAVLSFIAWYNSLTPNS